MDADIAVNDLYRQQVIDSLMRLRDRYLEQRRLAEVAHMDAAIASLVMTGGELEPLLG